MIDSRTPRPLSVAAGDYLKAIWEAADSGVVSAKEIARRLSVSSASVSGMFGRLQDMRFVEYEHYRGASLTERGREEALRLVRRHRLIETLLVEHLGYSWHEVHEEAERLEHAVSDEFTERLAEFLGHPDRGPHGNSIPAADGTLDSDDSFSLAKTVAGDQIRIVEVADESPATLDYLGERRLVPGRLLEVREVREVDGVVTVEDEGGGVYSLGAPVAGSILVRGSG